MSIKFPSSVHPGHHLFLFPSDAPSQMNKISGNSNFVGSIKTFNWTEIETTKNSYEAGLNKIQTYLDWIDANQPGNQFWVRIEGQSAGNYTGVFPQYLWNEAHADYDPAYNPRSVAAPNRYGAIAALNNGEWYLAIWLDAVRSRYKALFSQIYARFSTHPTFAGFVHGETVGGTTSANRDAADDNKAARFAAWEDVCDQKALLPLKCVQITHGQIFPGNTAAEMRGFSEYAIASGCGLNVSDIVDTIDMFGIDTTGNVHHKVMREQSQRFGVGGGVISGMLASGSNGVTCAETASAHRNLYGTDIVFWKAIQQTPDTGKNFNPNALSAVSSDVASYPYATAWPWAGTAPATDSNAVFDLNRVALNTSTGAQVLSHTAGTPKLWQGISGTGITDATTAAVANISVGATDGTRQVSLSARSANGISVGSQFGSTIGATDTLWSSILGGSAGIDGEASYASWDTDDVTINISNAPAAARLLTYGVLSGSDVSAYVNNIAVTTVDTEVTLAPGFESNIIFVEIGAGQIDDSFDSNMRFSAGAAVWNGSLITQYCIALGETNSTNPTAVGQYAPSDYIGAICDQTGTIVAYVELTAVTSTEVKFSLRGASATIDLKVTCIKIANTTLSLNQIILPASTSEIANEITANGYYDQVYNIGVEANFGWAAFSLISSWDTGYNNSQAGSMGLSLFNTTEQYCNSYTVQDNKSSGNSVTKSLSDDVLCNLKLHDGSDGFTATLHSINTSSITVRFTKVAPNAGIGWLLAVQTKGDDTTAPTTPGQPATCTNITQTTMTIGSWTASTDADSGLRDYLLYNDGVLFETGSPILTNAPLDVVGLASNTLYAWTVKARDNAGNLSSASAVRTATTLSPADVTAAVFSGVESATVNDIEGTIGITWPQAHDSITPDPQMRYKIYDDNTQVGAFSTHVATTPAGALNYLLQNVEPGDHWIGVRSIDTANNEDTNTALMHVVVSAITGSYIIPAGTFRFDNGAGSYWSNIDVEMSFSVNGSSGYMASAQHYDLGTVTLDENGYNPELSIPTSEPGELTVKYESGGVLLGRWVRNITPTPDS